MLVERGTCLRTRCAAQGFEGTPQLLLQRLIVLIERVDLFGRAAEAGFAEPGEDGFNHAFAQNEDTSQNAHAVRTDAAPSAALDPVDRCLGPRFRKILTGVACGVIRPLAGEQLAHALGQL